MKKKYILWSILTVISIVLFAVCSVFVYYFNAWWTMILTGIMFIVAFCFTCYYYFPNAEFICNKCNKQFKPTINASVMGIHTITRRYLKCPHCNQKSWCKETWNINNKNS